MVTDIFKDISVTFSWSPQNSPIADTFYLFALNTDFSLELLLYQKLKPPLTKINLKIKKNTPTLNSVTPI